MTALRQNVADYAKINSLYSDDKSKKKEAFSRLEQLRGKGTVTDYKAELASYREEKYFDWDSLVIPNEREENVDEYMREMRENDRHKD